MHKTPSTWARTANKCLASKHFTTRIFSIITSYLRPPTVVAVHSAVMVPTSHSLRFSWVVRVSRKTKWLKIKFSAISCRRNFRKNSCHRSLKVAKMALMGVKLKFAIPELARWWKMAVPQQGPGPRQVLEVKTACYWNNTKENTL